MSALVAKLNSFICDKGRQIMERRAFASVEIIVEETVFLYKRADFSPIEKNKELFLKNR
jgi:hypothetical protein